MERRTFLKTGAGAFCVSLIGTQETWGMGLFQQKEAEPFEISLAQWSLHKRHFGQQGEKLDNLDFAATAKGFGIHAIEYVNQMFKDKGEDKKYLKEMKKRAKDAGVKSLLIMCDGEGKLGDPDKEKRKQAVENHHKWVEAAKLLGCHSIRVNASSSGSYEEQQKLAADGLARLSSWAGRYGLNVIVENHGGLSSHGDWLAGVITMVDKKNCGTLPDFGNFPKEVNR
ncbi:MAG: sugar phosphate isomerase/epimerase, partial [Planctomycetes bacterium]|nr:sugar phosphate isomerase/epimerase [Planctomycetota bacterium]